MLYDYLWLAHLQFVAFAAHGFDKHREVQHATSEHRPFILVVGFLDAQGKVLVKLAGKAFVYVPGCYELAVFAEERAVVDGESHRHGGFVDGDAWQRFGIGDR